MAGCGHFPYLLLSIVSSFLFPFFSCRKEQRMVVYRTLLNLLALEHRLALSAKLCAEILALVLDGVLDLNNEADRATVQVS